MNISYIALKGVIVTEKFSFRRLKHIIDEIEERELCPLVDKIFKPCKPPEKDNCDCKQKCDGERL